jgi:transposase
MPRRSPPEFRRKVLHLLKAGRKIAQIAAELGVTRGETRSWSTPDNGLACVAHGPC